MPSRRGAVRRSVPRPGHVGCPGLRPRRVDSPVGLARANTDRVSTGRLMPLPQRMLVESATIERMLWALGALLVAVLLVRARRARGSPGFPRLAIGRRAERVALLVVLAWALVTRLGGCASPYQPRNYYAQISVVHTAEGLRSGDLGRRWLTQLRNVQVLFEHQSPIQAPVSAALQRV